MTDTPHDNLTFEHALAELEHIVHELEDGAVGLEESLARYEKGVGLLKRCYSQLRQAEQRIQLLTSVDDEDRPIARAFDHSATVEAERPEKKKRRKIDEQPEMPF